MKAALIPGIMIGVLAGWRWKHAHRAWRDWKSAAAAVPVLRRLFRRHALLSLLWGVAVIVAVVAVLHL